MDSEERADYPRCVFKRSVWLNLGVCILSVMPALDLWRVLRRMNPQWLTAYDFRVFSLGIAATGAWAFIFIFLTLAVTPVMRPMLSRL